MQPLLKLDAVEKHFVKKTYLGKESIFRAVDGVTLAVNKGDTLGIVGESGCGKSTLANLIVRLEEPTGGRIFLEGVEISHLPEARLRPLRPRIQIIFQDPYSSLNPRMNVEQIITEPMRVLGKWTQDDMRGKAVSLLNLVGLTSDHLRRYPHEFSGGQRQRLSIARALTTEPEILILDEPTSALDVSVQAQVLNLLQQLQKKLGLTYVFISHNLAVVKYVANRAAVMYLGKILETGKADDIMLNPVHPYTQELISAVPAIGKPLASNRPDCGNESNKKQVSSGCLYRLRCRQASSVCSQVMPELQDCGPDHQVACWEVGRNA
ncbi:oligopeptide/dipeptide ABC transporter ATP-binding protein [Sporomusa malonica]|uniref:Oligopeptide transport system ATP-binding protein n=1 Tax=Sporomusa malonica TaxID=112901 RepID=A0A1W1Y870_9FIRM|nr:oligopeptide/dipeptide ABC transporter ATP-binding protein [Sporomusa malonica]SMC32372.1 oligopeptide transport system ATP-binding protein [Sporomusa malonica]